MIQPDLEYAALTFTPSMNAGLRIRLLAAWRKAIRCAAGVGYQDEVTPLLSEFRLTNIVDRWIVKFACYVRRCVKQEAPSTSCAKLQWPAHRHCTRAQENSFRPFLANNRAGLVSFSNRAPLIWNSLPADVREAPWKRSGAQARDQYWVNVEMARRHFLGPGRADRRRRPSPIQSRTSVHVFEPSVSGSACIVFTSSSPFDFHIVLKVQKYHTAGA